MSFKNCGFFSYQSFVSLAILAISFFVPTLSKATSKSKSPPMGFAEITIPSPNALCNTLSPALRSTVPVAVVLPAPLPLKPREKPLFRSGGEYDDFFCANAVLSAVFFLYEYGAAGA